MIPLALCVALGLLLIWWALDRWRNGASATDGAVPIPPIGGFPDCVVCGNAATRPWRTIRAQKSRQRIHGAAPTYSIVDGEQHRLCDPHYRMVDSRLEQELSAARALIGETLTLVDRRFAQLEMGELLTWAQVEAATAHASIDDMRSRELQPRQLTGSVPPTATVVVLGEHREEEENK